MSHKKHDSHKRECKEKKQSTDRRVVDDCGCFQVVDACGCRVIDPCGCYVSQCCC